MSLKMNCYFASAGISQRDPLLPIEDASSPPLKSIHLRTGLAIFLALGLASSGCASWNKLIGKKDEPSPKVNLAWAKLKESEGNLTDARHSYEAVLAKDPKNVHAILGMARLNLKAKRLPDAEAGFEKALALNPHSTEVLSEIGNFFSDQQRWDKAIPLLQEAQRLEPHEKNYQFNLAVALAKSGQVNESMPHFKDAVGDAAAHYNVGRILVEKGKPADAEEQFVLALSKDPNLADAQFFLDEIRAGSLGKAQQVPILADTNRPGYSAQQVAGTGPVHAGEPQNPFEEAPGSGFSQSDSVPARPVSKSQTRGNSSPSGRSKPIPSGRQPVRPHEGFEELDPPAEYADAPVDRTSASAQSFASSVVLASAEVPASDSTETQKTDLNSPPRLIPPHRLVPVSRVGTAKLK